MNQSDKGPAFAFRQNGNSGFTLIELLVCLAIIALLVTLIVPSTQQARAIAKLTICQSNEKQIGIMINQYGADCNDFIPQPTTIHGIMNKSFLGGGPNLAAISLNQPSVQASCPEYVAQPYDLTRNQPLGPGWFYFQGYIGQVIGVKPWKLGVLSCPDSPYVSRYRGPYTAGAGALNEYAIVTNTLASRNYTGLSNAVGNPDGGNNYDCLSGFRTDYYFRGWALNNYSSSVPRISSWKPTNAVAIDYESIDFAAPTGVAQSPDSVWYWKVHQTGLNILFMDGHAKFGGQNLLIPTLPSAGPQPPHAYYSFKQYNSLVQSMSPGQGSNSGWPYAGNYFSQLWNYYETGNP